MSDNDSEINNQDCNSESVEPKPIKVIKESEPLDETPTFNSSPKWINNRGEEVKQVFGFNENAELVNARVAMVGFLMLILTELAFAGEPATQKIFGIN
tara:strand:+ start:2728 stop:3021 length:294 start_codon:yes stop_codon:yes gene_type:complete